MLLPYKVLGRQPPLLHTCSAQSHLVLSRQEAGAVHVALAQPGAQLARLALPRQRKLPTRAPARQHGRRLCAAPAA